MKITSLATHRPRPDKLEQVWSCTIGALWPRAQGDPSINLYVGTALPRHGGRPVRQGGNWPIMAADPLREW
jgi:hypothetical protein